MKNGNTASAAAAESFGPGNLNLTVENQINSDSEARAPKEFPDLKKNLNLGLKITVGPKARYENTIIIPPTESENALK